MIHSYDRNIVNVLKSAELMSYKSKTSCLTKEKSFSLDEVNQMIPFLEKTFIRIHQLNSQVKETLQIIGCDEDDFSLDSIDLANNSQKENESVYDLLTDLKLFLSAIQSSVSELSKTGCSIRNLENGHVEWLASIEPDAAYLSWKLGDLSATLMRDDLPTALHSTQRVGRYTGENSLDD
ncbi:MAG: hypothetical protein CMF41_04600 [Legionellales bacterium]|nr:hypothetical protein [Legionellales bacterium]OUX64864.1 MAG: hypothetical protein CBE41_02515 [Gammaproteobacteria bacterium TMED281]|tara:strand:+ start:367 stop:903 length:537 start_codon:yes stop_codon:yes gene_type:complete